MKRRNLLTSLVSAACATALPGALARADSSGDNVNQSAPARHRLPWRNWSGSQICYPDSRKAPSTIDQLREVVRNARGTVRPVGAGHSFMPLVPTDDTIISLSRISGIIGHDHSKQQAVILAGTRLGDIGAPLAERGQALINMPDIDEQSLAGALGTATHGTGATLGCMPANVRALKLVSATGDIWECSADNNADLYQAARVNLGALGVITEVTMQNQPKYNLKRETAWLAIEEILENADNIADSNRNFEFYYIPFSGMGFIDVHNMTTDTPSSTAKLDQNDGAETLKQVRDWLSWSPKVRQLILSSYMNTIAKEVTVASSWENYTSERNVRFNEMEYHLPRETALTAFREIIDTVEKHFPEVFFPFEFRFVKSDDIWMSPFYARDSCSIAIHRYFREDYRPLFKAVEPIFRKYHGRPHWGKLNTLRGTELAALYPHWHDFQEVRRAMDPDGKFLNPYLKTLFA